MLVLLPSNGAAGSCFDCSWAFTVVKPAPRHGRYFVSTDYLSTVCVRELQYGDDDCKRSDERSLDIAKTVKNRVRENKQHLESALLFFAFSVYRFVHTFFNHASSWIPWRTGVPPRVPPSHSPSRFPTHHSPASLLWRWISLLRKSRGRESTGMFTSSER